MFHHQVGIHELSYEGETVGEIIDKFIKEYGKKLDKTLLDPGSKTLRQFILILVNGRNINFLDGLNTKLAEGDVVAITPPIGGG